MKYEIPFFFFKDPLLTSTMLSVLINKQDIAL